MHFGASGLFFLSCLVLSLFLSCLILLLLLLLLKLNTPDTLCPDSAPCCPNSRVNTLCPNYILKLAYVCCALLATAYGGFSNVQTMFTGSAMNQISTQSKSYDGESRALTTAVTCTHYVTL